MAPVPPAGGCEGSGVIALALLRHSELPLASSEGSGVTVVLTTLHAVIRWGKTGGKTGEGSAQCPEESLC